jgi:hypothetical protein
VSDDKPKVIELFSRRPVEPEPQEPETAPVVNTGLVKALEDLLVDAKKGWVQGVAFTALYPNPNAWFEFISGVPLEVAERFVARLEMMKRTILDDLEAPMHTGDYPDPIA